MSKKTGRHILIVEARFYPDIADALLEGAKQVLSENGFTCEVVTVPGALEIAPAVAFGAKAKKFAGFIALGCVIRGETGHYDHVASESVHALQMLAIKKKLAIGTGILTVESMDQALARAGGAKGNKGAFAARACLDLIGVKEHLLGKS